MSNRPNAASAERNAFKIVGLHKLRHKAKTFSASRSDGRATCFLDVSELLVQLISSEDLMADYKKLITICEQWIDEPEVFSRVVKTGRTALAWNLSDFAAEFGVAISTVSRWSDGSVTPHRLAQKNVVAFIKNEAVQRRDIAGKAISGQFPAESYAAKS